MSVGVVAQPAVAPVPRRSVRWRWWSLLAGLLLGAILFVKAYSSPMPSTDEWFFTKSIVAMQHFDLHTAAGIKGAVKAMPKHFATHWVIVPFLVYWPIAEWTGFDSRWFMYITVLGFVAEALLFWRFLFERSLWAFPVALLLLGPSHYMELLWGWQITLALSILFPLAGLVVIDRISPEQRAWKQALIVFTGLALCLLGLLSAAGGFFGFPCAVLLLFLKRISARSKVVLLAVALAATVVAYEKLMHGSAQHLVLGERQVGMALTALGGTIWGTPIGLFQFPLGVYSVTGILVVACILVVVRRADILDALPDLALPISITSFGLLCTLSIAMAREALGNWHLQYSLMAVCGAYAAAYRLRKIDKSWFSAVPFLTLLALLLLNVVAWWRGFTEFGPIYRAYIHETDQHALHFLTDPRAPKPYVGMMDVNANMMLFLSAHHHPVFQDEGPRVTTPLPESARVFLNRREIGQASSIAVERTRLERLTVVLPAATDARGVMARIGASDVMLRRIDPSLTWIPCAGEPGFVSYAALIVPRVLGVGELPMQISLLL